MSWTGSYGTNCCLVEVLYQYLPDLTGEKRENFSQHSQWLGWDLGQASPDYMCSVTTTPTYWAAAEDCHVLHIWSKIVRIRATYHTLQINPSPHCSEGKQCCTWSYMQTYTCCSSLIKVIRNSLNTDYRLLLWLKQNTMLSFTIGSVYIYYYSDMPLHLPGNFSFSCVIIKWLLL